MRTYFWATIQYKYPAPPVSDVWQLNAWCDDVKGEIHVLTLVQLKADKRTGVSHCSACKRNPQIWDQFLWVVVQANLN